MRQLVYVSTASAMPHGDLEQILTSATRNNAEAEITGILLFNGKNFLQLLEGEHAVVEDLLDRVEADTRHSGLVVMTDTEVPRRSFPGWSMRLLRLSESIEERKSALDQQLPTDLDERVRRQILNFAALN